MNETPAYPAPSYATPSYDHNSYETPSPNHQSPAPAPQGVFAATTIQFQRAVAQRVAQRAKNAEVLSPGDWLRRVGGLQAPFGFDGMPTVLG